MKKQILSIVVCVLTVVLFSSLTGAVESGPLAPMPFPVAGKAGPTAQSRFFVLESAVFNGTATVTLPIDTPANAVALILGESKVRALTGDQMALEPMVFEEQEMKRMNLPAGNTRFDLGDLPAGSRVLFLNNINGKRLKMVVSQPDTPLTLAVQVTPLAARSGQRVTVTARMSDEAALQYAEITAAPVGGSLFKLNDQGLDGDLLAGDGIYSGGFKAPAVDGFNGINIRFSAEGERHDGSRFLRNAISSVMVSQVRSGFVKENIAVSPVGLTVPVKASSDRYRVEVIFGNGETSLAFARENIEPSDATRLVSLPLPQSAAAADRALIRLLNRDTMGLEDETLIKLTPTQALPDLKTPAPTAVPLPPSKERAVQLMKEKE